MLVKTEELKKLVNKNYECCGLNNQIPITELFGLKATKINNETYLKICSTDTINYEYNCLKIDTNETFDICINATIFTQLINKFTTSTVEITLETNYLKVVGNGEYKLEIALLDNGLIQTFEEKHFNANLNKVIELDINKIKFIKNYCESSLSKQENEVDLNGYYIDNNFVISTNRQIMTSINVNLNIDKLVLRKKFIDLLSNLEEEKVLLYYSNENEDIMIRGTNTSIYSSINSKSENYPVEQIKSLIDTSTFKAKYKINKSQLLNILDRINVVVTKYDSNVIELLFSGNSIFVSSMKETGSEVIELENNDIPEDFLFSCKINSEWLQSQLTTFTEENIDLFVGNEICVKLSNDNIIKLICLA